MTKLKGNKPLDRDYFRQKERPDLEGESHRTICCDESVDRDVLNVNNEEDWKLIENHIERHLTTYSNTEKITPIVCKECGRLQEYQSVLKLDRKLPGDK